MGVGGVLRACFRTSFALVSYCFAGFARVRTRGFLGVPGCELHLLWSFSGSGGVLISQKPSSTNETGKEDLRPGPAGNQLSNECFDDFQACGDFKGSDECAYAAWLQRCEETRLRMERRTAGNGCG